MSDRNSSEEIHIFVGDTAGERYECDVPVDTKLSEVAADFFEARGWPATDSQGRRQRAVVELVDPNNPERTKRLRGDQTVDQADLFDGAVLRIFPESIAGRVDERERIRALVADHRDMDELVGWNPHVRFRANTTHAPTRYEITFDYESFRELSSDGHTPVISEEHRAEVILGAGYPRYAPMVRWLTPIFHPNIRPGDGAVCLGVLSDRYLPGLGLARLVIMLTEMVQWRNFDTTSPLNNAAAEWGDDPDHWEHIRNIGGYPFQGPVHELFRQLEELWQGEGKRPRIRFKRATEGRDTQ